MAERGATQAVEELHECQREVHRYEGCVCDLERALLATQEAAHEHKEALAERDTAIASLHQDLSDVTEEVAQQHQAVWELEARETVLQVCLRR